VNCALDSYETNPYIIHRWLQVSIRCGLIQPPFEEASEFVGKVGRHLFIIPVYNAMKDVDIEAARAVFRSHETFYHPIALRLIKNVLEIPQDSS